MSRPGFFGLVFLLALVAVGFRGAGGARIQTLAETCKPQPGVSLLWQVQDPLLPGTEARVSLEIQAHVPVDRIQLRFPERTGGILTGSWPEFSGRPEPGEVVAFPMRVRVPAGPVPPLEALVEVESGGRRYTVGAHLDLARNWRTGVLPGRDSVSGLSKPWEFEAGRLLDEPPLPQPLPRPPEAPESILFYGRFFYRDRVLDPLGFSHADPSGDPTRPIRFADVDLLENGELIASGSTDAFGVFVFSVSPATGTEDYRVRVRSQTSGWEGADLFILFSPSNSTPTTAISPPIPAPGHDSYVGDFLVEPEAGAESFNILDSFTNGVLFLENLGESLPVPPLAAYWNVNSTQSTHFSPGLMAIYLSGDDGYDDPVILHEFGHYAVANYSRDDNPGGAHYVDDSNQDPRLSWSEGFASYFQASVRSWIGESYPSWYIDTDGTPGRGQLIFSYDCEGPGLWVTGAGSEVAIQAMLWDIEDERNTPGDIRPGFDDDPLELNTLQIWEVLTDPIKSAADVTLEDFWDGWFSPSIDNGYLEEMRGSFSALGAEFQPDAFEDDDAGGDPNFITLDGIPRHHTFFPGGDLDRIQVILEPGSQITVETLNILGFGDTKLEVFDPDGFLVAMNDDRSSSDFSSMIAFTAESSGSHSVVVSRSSLGPKSRFLKYGSYDIRALVGVPNQNTMALESSASGVADPGFGIGVAMADYDSDGLLDIYLVNNPGYGPSNETDALYRNTQNLRFFDVTAEAGLGVPGGGVGAAWGDFDNDDDPDLFVTDHGLYRNEGDGTFADVTLASGVADVGREFDSQWVDTDSDGLLDLFVVRRDGPSALWHNNGDGTFTDIASDAGFSFPLDGAEAYSCSWGDFNGDLLPDLFMAHRTEAAHSLYRNLGDNRFEDVTEAAGLGSNVPAVSGVWGDINRDGLLDLFVAATGRNSLYLNRGDGTFSEEASRYGIDHPGNAEGASLADYDLDGDLDLFVANLTGANTLYENLGSSMIRTNQAGDAGIGFGCSWGDLDNDGDPDLYVSRGCGPSCETNRLYRNNTIESGSGNWLKVRLRGNKSNRDGFGARVRIFTGAGIQTREMGTETGWASKNLAPLIFGVPDGAEVDSVVVDWPAGGTDRVLAPGLDRLVEVIEDAGTPVLPENPGTPSPLQLSAASPNPFTDATTLNFTLSGKMRVAVDVFDITGRRVRRLMDREAGEGTHVLGWDGKDDHGRSAATGIFFYRIRTPVGDRVRKLVRVAG